MERLGLVMTKHSMWHWHWFFLSAPAGSPWAIQEASRPFPWACSAVFGRPCRRASPRFAAPTVFGPDGDRHGGP